MEQQPILTHFTAFITDTAASTNSTRITSSSVACTYLQCQCFSSRLCLSCQSLCTLTIVPRKTKMGCRINFLPVRGDGHFWGIRFNCLLNQATIFVLCPKNTVRCTNPSFLPSSLPPTLPPSRLCFWSTNLTCGQVHAPTRRRDLGIHLLPPHNARTPRQARQHLLLQTTHPLPLRDPLRGPSHGPNVLRRQMA